MKQIQLPLPPPGYWPCKKGVTQENVADLNVSLLLGERTMPEKGA